MSKAVALLNDVDDKSNKKRKPKLKREPSPHPRREETSHVQQAQDADSSERGSSERRSVRFRGRTGAFMLEKYRNGAWIGLVWIIASLICYAIFFRQPRQPSDG